MLEGTGKAIVQQTQFQTSNMQLLRNLLQCKDTAFIHNTRKVNLGSGHQNNKILHTSMYVSVILSMSK